jgi:hypothetical protein
MENAIYFVAGTIPAVLIGIGANLLTPFIQRWGKEGTISTKGLTGAETSENRIVHN